jgi:hypothetical protein
MVMAIVSVVMVAVAIIIIAPRNRHGHREAPEHLHAHRGGQRPANDSTHAVTGCKARAISARRTKSSHRDAPLRSSTTLREPTCVRRVATLPRR